MSILSSLAASSGVGGKSMSTISEADVSSSIETVIPSSEVSSEITEAPSDTVEEVIPSSEDSPEVVDESVLDYDEIAKEDPDKSVTKTDKLVIKTALPPSRDYTGFNEQEISYLKKTGNESFAYLSKELRQAKANQTRIAELEKAQDANVSQFSDPTGYQSTEEYTAVVAEYDKATNFVDHWKKQLTNIHDAKPWTDIEQDANGKLVGVEREASAEALSEITDRLMSVKNYQSAQLQKANAIQQQWTSKSQQLPTFVEAKTKEFFPEHASKTDDKNYKQMEAVLKQMGQGKNPVARLLNTMYAAHMDLIPKYLAMETEYKKLKEAATARQVNAKLGKQVEPSPTIGKTVKAINSGEVFDYDEIAKTMA